MKVETTFGIGDKVQVPFEDKITPGLVDRVMIDLYGTDVDINYRILLDGGGSKDYTENNIIGGVPD